MNYTPQYLVPRPATQSCVESASRQTILMTPSASGNSFQDALFYFVLGTARPAYGETREGRVWLLGTCVGSD